MIWEVLGWLKVKWWCGPKVDRPIQVFCSSTTRRLIWDFGQETKQDSHHLYEQRHTIIIISNSLDDCVWNETQHSYTASLEVRLGNAKDCISERRGGWGVRASRLRLVLATRIVSTKLNNKLDAWILLIANTDHPVSNSMVAQTGPTTPRAMASVEWKIITDSPAAKNIILRW
jgi:hypothetical protein